MGSGSGAEQGEASYGAVLHAHAPPQCVNEPRDRRQTPPPGYSASLLYGLHISRRVHTSESAVRPSLCFRAHLRWLLAAAKGGKLEECAARELGAERNSVLVGTWTAAYFVGCWLVAVSSDISCAGLLTSGVQDSRQVSEWIYCACCELRKR